MSATSACCVAGIGVVGYFRPMGEDGVGGAL
jgi:hypothetical protein